jgi:putative molybdopterin biosynthesis protein
MDPDTGEYNRPYVGHDLDLVRGYRRRQGLVYRPGDARFVGRTLEQALEAALGDAQCTMVNRNTGSGTRILIDRLLAQHAAQPQHVPGYAVQAKSHNAVAAAVAQGRADWGVAIDTVARAYGLAFLPYQDEHYDFVVPKPRLGRPAVQAFRALLAERTTQEHLRELGFRL